MKKIILGLLLSAAVLLSFQGKAQLNQYVKSIRFQGQDTLSFTPQPVGTMIMRAADTTLRFKITDSTWFNFMGGGSGATGTLQDVTTNGNTTTTPIYVKTLADSVHTTVYFFGDSKVIGVGQPNVYTKWISRVSAVLGVTGVNKGVSGQTMQASGNSMQNRLAEIPAYNATTNPYIFFSYAANDIQSNPATFTTALFNTSYQTVLDACYALNWPPSKIFVIGMTPDAGYEARVTSYNTIMYALPAAFARNNGLNVINVFNSFPSNGTEAAMYFSGPHENASGMAITAATIIAALPNQSIKRNGQGLAVNSVIEASRVVVKNTVASLTNPYSLAVIDTMGNIGQMRGVDYFLQNSLGSSSTQIASAWISGNIAASNGYFSGTFLAAPSSLGVGVHLYQFGGAGYLQADNATMTGPIAMNYRGTSHTFDHTVAAGGLSATGLASNPGATYSTIGVFGGVAKFYGQTAGSTYVDLNLGNAQGLWQQSTGKVYFGTTPSYGAKVTIEPGTATAGTAPLLFSSGTWLTVPVSGTWDFNGATRHTTNYFQTGASGTTGLNIGSAVPAASSTFNGISTNGINDLKIFGSDGTVGTPSPGTLVAIYGATAYQTSGNNTGGDVNIQAGQGRGASGKDGNITLVLNPGSGTSTPRGYFILSGIPTSSAGLPSGAVWSNAGILSIVP